MKFFRTHEKLIVWIVVLVIIPVFGIGTLLTTMIGGRKSRSVYGTLDGKKVTHADLVTFAVKHGFTRVETKELLKIYREYQQHKNLGFRISEQEITEYIREMGMFTDDKGNFSNKLFKRHLERNNLTRELFIEAIKERLLIEKLSPRGENILSQPVPVTKDEILFQYHLDNDRYKVKYAIVPVEKLPEQEIPKYEEIKAVYDRGRIYAETGSDKTAQAFFEEFPIQEKLFKQWIIVEYIGISKKDIEKYIEIKDSAVVEYYAENRETKYRVKKKKEKEEKEGETAKDKDTEEKEKPEYRRLDDELKQEISALLTAKEAERILELVKDKINERKIDAENKGTPITLNELASEPYFPHIPISDTCTRRDGKVVYWNISNPVDLPRSQTEIYTKGIVIDKKMGRISFQNLRDALTALAEPDPDIATSFLKTESGYCMFMPVWWPNMNIENPRGRGSDLTYTVPFPDKKTLGLEPEPETTELDSSVREQSLLEIKLENMKLKASIILFNTLKKHLAEKKAKDRARRKAEKIYPDIQPGTFDAVVASKGLAVKTNPFETLPDGGAPVQACYFLEPKGEKSEIFFDTGGPGATKGFFGIGILLEREKAEDSEIPQKEIDSIRKQCMRKKQSDFLTVVTALNSLLWEPK